MNPALPILLLSSAAGLLVRRSGFGLAWAAVGLAVTALLAPALLLPAGIPSPAASLAEVAPWQHTGDPREGNATLRDVTYQIEPWLLHVRRELRAGRLPLWNPYQFSGGPFWANGQSAPLFPLHLLFAALPLELGFVLLPWLRLVVAGTGVWVLARELGVDERPALVGGVVFALSGMLVSFALFPMGNALALVPWVLWTVERLAAGSGRWWGLALAGGVQVLGGHPETSMHTALLAVLYLAARGGSRRSWSAFAGGWLAAAGLAAVQLLPLALLLRESSRWLDQGRADALPFAVVWPQPLRALLPQLYGHPADETWWGPFNYSATAVYAGGAALPLALAGVADRWRDRRWLALALLLAFAFAAAYQMPGLRQLLGALPIAGRALHHRLIFGVELGLALFAAAGCQAFSERRGRRGLAIGAGLAVVGLALAWWRFAADWSARGRLAEQAAWTGLVAGWLLALALGWRLAGRHRRLLAPLAAALLAADLVAAHARIHPGLELARLYPPTPAVEFLRDRPERVAGLGEALRPNAAMVYGLHDVRGDDPVKLRRYESVYARFAAADPVYFRPIGRWDSAWLDRLGVRWVVGAPREAAAEPGWRLAYEGSDARVYERPGAMALVRWADGGARGLAVRRPEPGAWDVSWSGPSLARRIVVAETWDGGWRALIDRQPAPVEIAEELHPAVDVVGGSGTLRLRYRPRGLLAGAALTAVAGVLLIAAVARPSR
jgi:hypothetical protein